MILANRCRRMRPSVTVESANGALRAPDDQFYYAARSVTLASRVHAGLTGPVPRCPQCRRFASAACFASAAVNRRYLRGNMGTGREDRPGWDPDGFESFTDDPCDEASDRRVRWANPNGKWSSPTPIHW